MTPDRWTHVKDVLSLALKQPGAARAAVVADACGDDAELRREVEDLLRSEQQMGDFLAEPILGAKDASETEGDLPAAFAQWRHYEVEERLGSGGMAVVYKARDPRLQRPVAIKVMAGGDELTRQRFVREAEAQARINHDNVLKVYETGSVGRHHYIAMQYVEGPTLLGVRDETTLERKVELMVAIAEGLHEAHRQGLVHRDIKPGNILVERRPEGLKPYLLDFGLAVDLDSPGLTKTGVVLGTPKYMPPERIAGGTAALDRRSDIYSLGAACYEFLSGAAPFDKAGGLEVLSDILQGDFVPLRKRQPSIPPELDAIVGKCLEKDPAKRYPSARALADELRRYLDGEPVSARPAGAFGRLAKKARRHPRLTAAFAVMTAATLTLVGWAAYQSWHATRQAALAQQLGGDVRDIDWLFRAAQMSPLHALTPHKEEIRRRITRLEAMLADGGSFAVGPVNYAIGRGLLTLGDAAGAVERLERAWASGYHAADAAMALGLAHSEVFRVESDRARRLPGERERTRRMREIAAAHRDRALRYFESGRSSTLIPATFADALIASTRGDMTAAIDRAGQAARETPWLFEAPLLAAHLQLSDAIATYIKGDKTAGYAKATAADRGFAEAERIAPSAIDAHVGRCTVAGLMVHMALHQLPIDPQPPYRQAHASCSRALAVDPQHVEAHRLYGEALRVWGSIHVLNSRDPGDAYDRATELVTRAVELGGGSRDALLTLADTHLDRAWWERRSGRDPRPTIDLVIGSLEKVHTTFRSAYAAHSMGESYILRRSYELSNTLDPGASIEGAVVSYQKALTIDPEIASGLESLGEIAVKRADYQSQRGIDPKPGLQQVLRFYEQLGGNPAQPERVRAVRDIRERLEQQP